MDAMPTKSACRPVSGATRIAGACSSVSARSPPPQNGMAAPWGRAWNRATTRSGKNVIEQAPAWNPQLVELTVAAQHTNDDPVVWASLAHALRRSSDSFAGDLVLALPLHLAWQAAEYALPDTEEPDDGDEPEADA